MRKCFLFLSIIIFMSLSSGCMIFPHEENLLAPDLLQPVEVGFITMEVEVGSIQNIINDSVIALSSEFHQLSFHNRAGYLEEFHVRTGQDVAYGDVLARLETDVIEMDIKRQNLTIELLQLSLAEVRAMPQRSRFSIRRAELELEMAQLALEVLKKEYERTTITSPIDGVVMYTSAYGIGDFIPARSLMVSVADPEQIQFQYNGPRVRDIKLGMEVTIVIDDREVPARVTLTPDSAPVEKRDDYQNTVIITVNNPIDIPPTVDMGNRYQFSLMLEEKDDIIVIPADVVSVFMGQYYVQVLENGLRFNRDIVVGIVTRDYIEVVRGIEVGETLIIDTIRPSGE